MGRFRAILSSSVMIATFATTIPCYGDDERIPSDTLWRYQARYLHALHGLATAWNTFRGSPDVRVAVLDGAFRPDHGDFDQGRFYRIEEGQAGVVYHGTQVASIIGAKSDNVLLMTGVDWSCKLGLYGINPTKINDIVDGFAVAVIHGARVINCSWREQAGPGFPWRVQRQAAEVYQAGAVIVASAGHKDYDYFPPFPVAPASFDGLVICVTGLDQNGRVHDLSNWGWGTDFVSISDTIGVALTKTYIVDTAITNFDGTSLATPIVAGCASLIIGFANERGYADLDFDDVYQLLALGATRGGIDRGFWAPQYVGHGLPRPHVSFQYLTFPNGLERFDVTGPWTETVESLNVKVNLPGLDYGQRAVVRHELTATVPYPRPFYSVEHSWANGRLSAGAVRADEVDPSTLHWDYVGGTVTPNQWGEVVSYGATDVQVRTYWYEIPGYGAWPGTQTEGAKVAVTVSGELALTPTPSLARYDTVNATATTWFNPSPGLPISSHRVFMRVGEGNWSLKATLPATQTALLVYNINRGSETYSFTVEHLNPHQNSGKGPSASIHTRPNRPTGPAAEVVWRNPMLPEADPLGGMSTMEAAGPDPGDPVATTEVDVSWLPPENQAVPPAYYEIEAWQYGVYHTVEPCWATGCCPCKTIEVFTDIESLSQRLCLMLRNHQYEFTVYAIGHDGQRSIASVPVYATTGPADYCHPWPLDSLPVAWKPTAPTAFALHTNSPNPFNASTVIGFDLPTAQTAALDVFNILGQHVARPVEAALDAGSHRIEWDGRDWSGVPVPSGVYIYQLTAGGHRAVKKMVVLR